MLQYKTLDDLPDILPELRLLSVHGLGRGGGEHVASEIADVYASCNKQLIVMNSGAISWHDLAHLDEKAGSPVLLLTGGPRDLPVAALAVLARVPYAVYYQVPYVSATTWRDPAHALSVHALLTFNALFAQMIICNSSHSRPGGALSTQVVLPVRRGSIGTNASDSSRRRLASCDSPREIVLTTACRLFQERGRGSRDLLCLRRLLSECRLATERTGIHHRVEHFGEVHEKIATEFRQNGLPITFNGFTSDWISKGGDLCFFFSNYEGFGLAAFEAARAGLQVIVNEAFPMELMEAAPTIKRINTRDASRSLLEQMLGADNNSY